MNEREHITPSFRYVVVVCILSTVLMAVLNIAYTNYVDQKNRSAWCDLLITLDNRNQEVKVPTPDQVSFFQLITDLRHKQGCGQWNSEQSPG